MAKGIFLHSHNAKSDRYAIFEDDEKVAYLYLTKLGTTKPEKDAIAYSRVVLAAAIDWAKIDKTGEAPQLSRDIASASAIVRNPSASEFSFKWSPDGQAAALLRNGEPIAFASASEKYGYSKAVLKSSRLANAWNQRRYAAIFGK